MSTQLITKKVCLGYSQHEKRNLRQIKVGLNLLKVGYPTLRHQLNVVRGGLTDIYATVRKAGIKVSFKNVKVA